MPANDDRRRTIWPGSGQWVAQALAPSSRVRNMHGSEMGDREPQHETNTSVPAPSPAATRSLARSGLRQPGQAASRLVPILYVSPWTKYSKCFELQFGSNPYVVVAGPSDTAADSDSDTVLVQTLLGKNVQVQVQSIQRIQHPSFLAAQEIFYCEEVFSVSFDFMPISLAELAGNPLLADIHLSCILGQILEGLVYLEQNKLEHGRLTCANILVDQNGSVKIWGCEDAHDLVAESEDVRALGLVAAELIQGYLNEDDAVRIDNQARWPPDAAVVDFLRATTSAIQASALIKHQLLKLPWRTSKNHLKGLVALGIVWAKRGYRYSAA